MLGEGEVYLPAVRIYYKFCKRGGSNFYFEALLVFLGRKRRKYRAYDEV